MTETIDNPMTLPDPQQPPKGEPPDRYDEEAKIQDYLQRRNDVTEHCLDCGSQLCNHGNCPQCQPCQHCDGGDRDNRFFGYDEETGEELDQ